MALNETLREMRGLLEEDYFGPEGEPAPQVPVPSPGSLTTEWDDDDPGDEPPHLDQATRRHLNQLGGQGKNVTDTLHDRFEALKPLLAKLKVVLGQTKNWADDPKLEMNHLARVEEFEEALEEFAPLMMTLNEGLFEKLDNL